MAADTSMDVEMDIDLTLEEDPEVARLKEEAARMDAQAEADNAMMGVEELPEEGEVDSNAIVPKVHLRGTDNLTTQDLRNYAHEHHSGDLFKNVQWIDDTCANLVYDTETAAAEALQAFSAEEVDDPLQLRQAKGLSTHADVHLQARIAIEADVKIAGAKDRSRFYLMNPEHDPDTKFKKRRYDDRVSGGGHKRFRRDVGDELYHRRRSRDDEPFDVNLYDDDPKALAARTVRKDSYSPGSDDGRRKVKFDDDLFAHKQNGRLRNRSASPIRDGDGRYGFNDEQPQRRTARARSPTPPHLRKARANYAAREERRKELFPEKKAGGSAITNGNGSEATKLFPKRSSPLKTTKELFPEKAMHKRHDAKDLDPEEVTEAIGKYTLDGTSEQPAYTESGRRPENSDRKPRGEVRDLFSRISGGPKVESEYGRLHDRPSVEEGFSIKGAGKADAAGFSILGASRERAENPLVKELFPMKSGSNGKDLFDGRIKGRGSQRRRAEDLF